jgi:hypothetical protein
MVSEAKIEANRRNAKRSTGPRTAAGKNRSRYNALKHGMRAENELLPHEDPAAYQARFEIFTSGLKPRDELEEVLCDRAARASWLFDRGDYFHNVRQADRINDARNGARDEILALGRRLFMDATGPPPLYGTVPASLCARTSRSGKADDPDDPARLLIRLESSVPGCQWLIDRWAELLGLLYAGRSWQSRDKLKAIRLMGKQPLEAPDDPKVAKVFLASHALGPAGKHPFIELEQELSPPMMDAFLKRIEGRSFEAFDENNKTKARDFLIDLADSAMRELSRKQNELLANNPPDPASVAFDDSPEGERLWRYAMAADRSMHRQMDKLLRLRRARAAPGPRESAATDQESELDPDGAPPAPTGIGQRELGNGTSDRHAGPDVLDPPTLGTHSPANGPNRASEPTAPCEPSLESEPTAASDWSRRAANNQNCANEPSAPCKPWYKNEPTVATDSAHRRWPANNKNRANEATAPCKPSLENEPTAASDPTQRVARPTAKIARTKPPPRTSRSGTTEPWPPAIRGSRAQPSARSSRVRRTRPPPQRTRGGHTALQRRSGTVCPPRAALGIPSCSQFASSPSRREF